MCWHGRSEGFLLGSHTVSKGRERWNRHFLFVCFPSVTSHEHVLTLGPRVVHSDTEFECWRGEWEERSSVFCSRSNTLGIVQIVSFFCHCALLAHFVFFYSWQKVWRLRKPKFHVREISSIRENCFHPLMPGRMNCLHQEVQNWFWVLLSLTELPDPVLQELECQTRGHRLCCISHGLVRNLSFDVCKCWLMWALGLLF